MQEVLNQAFKIGVGSLKVSLPQGLPREDADRADGAVGTCMATQPVRGAWS